MIPHPDKIAVLITCHNRRETTLCCIDALFTAEKSCSITLKVYLVDDGSSDGTTKAIRTRYPRVTIIQGNGSLYWCGGMRLAWKAALSDFDYRFYLWINDDVVVNSDFLYRLFEDYHKIAEKHGPCLITGSCCDPVTGDFTYGGRSNQSLLIPNGSPRKCRYIHGNIVLVPLEIFNKIGGLSDSFTHALGDTDYGLRAIKAGFTCWATSAYIGKCRQHKIKGPWSSPDVPLIQRIHYFKSPLGLNIREYLIYQKRHWPFIWIFNIIKIYAQLLWPKPFELYSKIKLQLFNSASK